MSNITLSDDLKKQISELLGLTYLPQNLLNYDIADGEKINAILLYYAPQKYQYEQMQTVIKPLILAENPGLDFGDDTEAADDVVDDVVDEEIEEPASEEPVTEEPATEEPATEEPATEEPATEEPATEEPASEEPASEEPATEEPATEEPVTEEPASEEPAVDNEDGEVVN